jgi:hypothetical protein
MKKKFRVLLCYFWIFTVAILAQVSYCVRTVVLIQRTMFVALVWCYILFTLLANSLRKRRPLFHIRVDGPGSCDSPRAHAKKQAIYSRIDRLLHNVGWTTLEWSLRIPTRHQKYWLWYDNVHPKEDLVEDLVVGWVRRICAIHPTTVSLLLVGDSTTAYCFDRERGIKLADLAKKIKQRTGVRVWFFSVSGTSFTGEDNFTDQIEKATADDWTYDAVLLVGGWNQRHELSKEEISWFHNKAVAALTTW